MFGQQLHRSLGGVGGDDGNHAEAAVERGRHFGWGEAADALQPGEDRRNRPGGRVQIDAQAVRQDAGNVFQQPASRDMGERLHLAGAGRGQAAEHIQARRGEQMMAERSGKIERRRIIPCRAGLVAQQAHKRETVGMKPVGRETDHHVARGNRVACQHLIPLYSPDREPGKIVVAFRIHARQLRRFAADQGTVGAAASFGNAGDDICCNGRFKPPGAKIVEKEERLGAGDDKVVDAHGDEINADGFMLAGFDRDTQLGTDTIRRRDEQRITIPGLGEVEKAAETADAAHDARSRRVAGEGSDRFDEFVAGIDIDPGVLVAFGSDVSGFPSGGFRIGLGVLRNRMQSCSRWSPTLKTDAFFRRLLRDVSCVVPMLLSMALFSTVPAVAQDIYLVRDIAAAGTGTSGTAAERAAATRGAPAALRTLLKRLTRTSDHRRLPTATRRQARQLVKGLEVLRAKRLGSGRKHSFDGAFSYLFDPAKVAAYLTRSGIRWSDRRSDAVLVLPVWRNGGRLVLWDSPNPWRVAWGRTKLPVGLVPVDLAGGDIRDLQAIDGRQAGAMDVAALTAMAQHRDAKRIVVAVATRTRAGLSVDVRSFRRRGAVVTVLGSVRVRNTDALAEAAGKVVDLLEARWKQQVIDPGGPAVRTTVVARFDGVGDWTRIRETLKEAPTIIGFRVVRFSAGEATIAMEHRGDIDAVALKLKSVGLDLRQEGDSDSEKAWVLTATQTKPAGGE